MSGGEAFSRELADVHRMFRREFDLLPQIVLGVDDGDGTTARTVGSWVWEVLDALHRYRQAQEVALWPALMRRLALYDDAVMIIISRADEQLSALDHPRDIAQAAALRWQDGGQGTDRRTCGTTMASMREPLEGAFATVERHVAPIVDAHLTPIERSEIAHAAWLGARGTRRRALLAAVLEESDRREAVLRAVPMLWRVAAGAVMVEPHARRMAVIRQRGPSD